jgi:hypothetical protein
VAPKTTVILLFDNLLHLVVLFLFLESDLLDLHIVLNYEGVSFTQTGSADRRNFYELSGGDGRSGR